MEKLKVLLADDHDGFRRTLADFLRVQSGLEVVDQAIDGIEAIEKSERYHPDIVLMDINMPRRNGFEATKAIKSRLPLTKVILLSINAGEVYRQMAQQYSADYFVDKSCMKNALLAIVATVQAEITSEVAGVHAA